jgi:hypothetical protein
MKKAVSREELLRQWRDERRAKKQMNHQQPLPHLPHGHLNINSRPASSLSLAKPASALRQPSGPSSPPPRENCFSHITTKRIKVKVRRSDHTPNKSEPEAVTTLYERGTVAWRLKSKHPHHHFIHKPPPPQLSHPPTGNPPSVQQQQQKQKQPSSLPKERTNQHHSLLPLISQVRRKSEPNPIVTRPALVERSPNLLIPAGDGGAWKPNTDATPTAIIVKPMVDTSWKDFDLIIAPQDGQNWALSPMSSRSASILFGSPSSSPTHGSPRQQHRPRHYDSPPKEDHRDDHDNIDNDDSNDEPRRENRLTYIDLSPILQERTTATATADFPNVTSRSKSQRSIATSSVARSLSYQDDEPPSSSGDVSRESETSKKHRYDSLVPCKSISQDEGREPSDHCNGVSSVLDDVLELDTFEPRVYGRGSMKKPPHESTEQSSDHREHSDRRENAPSVDSDQDDTPSRFTQDHSRRSTRSSHGEVPGSLPLGDSLAKQNQQSIDLASTPHYPDGEGSFDWIDNLSPDDLFNRRVPSRRRTDFLPLFGSPLDRFRSQGLGTGEKSASSSIDSDIEEGLCSTTVAEDVAISDEPESIDRVSDQCSDIDSETEAASHDTWNEDEEGKYPAVFEHFVKVDGKTLLQPVREVPTLQTQVEQEGNQCSCSCCLERTEKWEELGHQLSELKWRAEIAELEKQKYQNQIYGIRKQYEVRVTPFRDIFEEVSWEHGS